MEYDSEVAAKVGNLAVRDGTQVLAKHVDGTRVRLIFLDHQTQAGRLTGTGSSHEEDELSTQNLKINAVEGGTRGTCVLFSDRTKANHDSSSLCGQHPKKLKGAGVPTNR